MAGLWMRTAVGFWLVSATQGPCISWAGLCDTICREFIIGNDLEINIFGREGTDTGWGRGGSQRLVLSSWKLGWPCTEF